MENVGSLNVLTACDLGIPEFVHLPVHCCKVLVDFGIELHQVLVFGWPLLFGLLLSKTALYQRLNSRMMSIDGKIVDRVG